MEKKNMVLLTVIAVATLLVAVVGATFAYFTATVQDTREDGSGKGETKVTAGSIANTTVVSNVSNTAGKFEKTGVYPGHIEAAGLSVTATHNKEETTNTKINIVYDVTSNEFAKDEIEINVYKSDSDLSLNNFFNCQHTSSPQDGNVVQFSETCDKEPDALVSELHAEKLTTTQPVKLDTGSKEDIVLATDTITTTDTVAKTVNYYVVVQFKNNSSDQNASMNAKLDGKITVEVA